MRRRPLLWRITVPLGLLCLLPACCGAQVQPVAFRLTPHVMRSDRQESVLLETAITGEPTSVVFERGTETLTANDAGMQGDALAGDGIYSVRVDPAPILADMLPEDVYRPLLGYVGCYVGDKQALRMNVKAEVWTPELPEVQVTQVAPDAQATAHLVNLIGYQELADFDLKRWTRRFYELCDDEYDFVVVVRLPCLWQAFRFVSVRNDVGGIGRGRHDDSAEWGSDGRLLAVIAYPISSVYDGADWTYQRELGRQWINYLQGTAFEPGIPIWPLSDVATGVMGLRAGPYLRQGMAFHYDLVPEGDGWRVRAPWGRPLRFNDLELYLMGLLPAEEVRPHFVFEDQDQEHGLDALLHGPVTTVTIEDLIARVGPRRPEFADSPKVFRIGTIIVSEGPLTAEEMAFYDFFTQRAELEVEVPCCIGLSKAWTLPFYASTGGRGRLDTSLGALREGIGG